MNKAKLVEEVANRTGLTKRASREVVDAVTSTITNRLARGEKVTLVGFGSFEVKRRKVRRGVNPFTGAEISIPAKDVPRFEPRKTLRKAVA